MKKSDIMKPQDPAWPATPLFLPAVLPVAANFPNFVSRYLGLIPNQENYHDLNESVFKCFEEVKNHRNQDLKYYKPNIGEASKHDVRKLFSIHNIRSDHFGSLTPFLFVLDHFKKKKDSENN